MIFTNSDYAPNNIPLIPTQIYSSILDFLHFFLLLYIARHKKAEGEVAACYLIFYSVGRFCIGIFQGRSGKGKYRSFIYLSVYQYFYRNRRNGNAWSNKEKDKEVNIQG